MPSLPIRALPPTRERIAKLRAARRAAERKVLGGSAPRPGSRRREDFEAVNTWGLGGAAVATLGALGPSFLPRTWWMTAASVGLAQIFGFALGAGARSGARGAVRVLAPRRDERTRGGDTRKRRRSHGRMRRTLLIRSARAAVAGGAAVAVSAAWTRSIERQREIARTVDFEPPTARTQALGLLAGSGIATALLGTFRLFQLSSKRMRRVLQRALPALAAPFSGTIVMIALTYAINRSVVWDRLMRILRERAAATNRRSPLGRRPPLEPERTGSPASNEGYNSLGRHGKSFASDGPRAADIADFWGTPAKEPVRAYVGLSARRPLALAAAAAVRELRRAGGFERRHLAIFITTGTGWLSDWSMSAFEYLTHGDCAIVSMQYSVLPSAVAFVADRTTPRVSARHLYRQVAAVLRTIPSDRQPRLYMSGESLGGYGGTSVFRDAADMLERIHGAVWAGAPRFTPIWRALERGREPGTPEVQPTIAGGKHIRFAPTPAALDTDARGRAFGTWAQPRVVFLQHASDPIVWWNLALMARKPDWLRERRGHDVTDAMRWYPWVTFWQVTADMPMSVATPGGHAHRYYEEYVPAWARVLGVEVDDAEIERLEAAIRPLVHPH